MEKSVKFFFVTLILGFYSKGNFGVRKNNWLDNIISNLGCIECFVGRSIFKLNCCANIAGNEFGDLFVTWQIKIPSGLTENEKELFRQLQKLRANGK